MSNMLLKNLHAVGMCKYCDHVRSIAGETGTQYVRPHSPQMPEDHPLHPNIDQLRQFASEVRANSPAAPVTEPLSGRDETPNGHVDRLPVPAFYDGRAVDEQAGGAELYTPFVSPAEPQYYENLDHSKDNRNAFAVDSIVVPEDAPVMGWNAAGVRLMDIGWINNVTELYGEKLAIARERAERDRKRLLRRFGDRIQDLTGERVNPTSFRFALDGIVFATEDGETVFVIRPCFTCGADVWAFVGSPEDIGRVICGVDETRRPIEYLCTEHDFGGKIDGREFGDVAAPIF